MANSRQALVRSVVLSVHTHSELLTNLFQLLLLAAVLEPTLLILAEIALMIALLLAAAQILCTFPGSYLYKFPGEMQI
jgi:hypothetical protein